MRPSRFFSGALGLLLCTCTPARIVVAPIESVTIPPPDELKPPKVSLYLGLPARDASYVVLDFFAKRDTLAYCWAEPDAFRIRTRPVEEPQGGGKEWRTTFLIKVGLLDYRSACTEVDIRWVVESRGFHDGNWTAHPDDPSFDPVLMADLQEQLGTKSCSGNP